MSDCKKLVYTPTSPDQYSEPNPDADDTVQGYDQPEVNASQKAAAAVIDLAGLAALLGFSL